MSQSRPSFANTTLWGAAWKLEIQAGEARDFDDARVRHALERHFGPVRDNYEDALNILKNDAILQYGVRDEQAATMIAEDFRSLSLVCDLLQQSSDPHEMYPAFLAPEGSYVSPPIVLSVSGGDGEEGAETASHLISRLCMIYPSSAVKSALVEARDGQPVECEVSYQEHADCLAQRLKELGYTVNISRSADDT
ncbi:hypothetical protein HQ447_00375 [bacterium]|nr:hypothetical protein [bacterium]